MDGAACGVIACLPSVCLSACLPFCLSACLPVLSLYIQKLPTVQSWAGLHDNVPDRPSAKFGFSTKDEINVSIALSVFNVFPFIYFIHFILPFGIALI